MTDSKRRPPRVANDAPTRTKHALWSWAEEQFQLSIGPKAFLCHLADHADDEARVFVVSKHFQRLMSASPRTITNYLRKLEEHELIAKTGEHMVFPGVQLPIYRLAPNDPVISSVVDGSEISAASETIAETSKFSKAGAEVSKLDPVLSKTERVYKENSTYSNFNTQEDASPLGVESAGPSVQEPPCDPSTFEPAIAFYTREFLEAFEEAFGSYLSEHFLASAKACPKTGKLHPDTPNAHSWFQARAARFLEHRSISLGMPWKALIRG